MSVKTASNYSGKYSTQPPWQGNELRQFWAAAKLAGIGKERVNEIVAGHYGKPGIKALTRSEWAHLLIVFSQYVRPRRREILSKNDPAHGRANDDQWARIRWLQGLLGWTDEHRDAYIKKHGHIDSIRFMSVDTGRAIITGMHKILDWQERQREKAADEAMYKEFCEDGKDAQEADEVRDASEGAGEAAREARDSGTSRR